MRARKPAAWRAFCGCALACAVALSARAEPVSLEADTSSVVLGPHVEVLLDPDGRLTLADIVRGPQARRFAPSSASVPSFGLLGGAVWLRFELERSADAGPFYLEVGYRGLEQLDYYAPAPGGGFFLERGGLEVPPAQRDVDGRHPVFQLPPPSSALDTHYLRIASSGPVIAPLILWSPATFYRQENRERVILGMVFGLIGAMLLYNLVAVGALREPIYLWHALSIGLLGLALFAESGLALAYLWPEDPHWDRAAVPFLVGLGIASFVPFARGLLGSSRYAPRLDSVMLALIGFATVVSACALLGLWSPRISYPQVLTMTMVLTAASMATALPVAFASARAGHRPARHLLAGFVLLAAMGIVVLLENTGWIEHSAITAALVPGGTVLFLLTTTIGLSERVALMRREKDEAQYVAAHDLLTGIPNRRRFHETLAREWSRALRGARPLSLVMMDLDHFKTYNDTYGHLAGDACLRVVAETLERTLQRPSDTVARYGGEEFAAVLPETDALGARLVAERLRNAIEELSIPLGSDHEGMTLSLGCATTTPERPLEAGELLAAADAALYRAKDAGRNRVFSAASLDRADPRFARRSYAAAPDDSPEREPLATEG